MARPIRALWIVGVAAALVAAIVLAPSDGGRGRPVDIQEAEEAPSDAPLELVSAGDVAAKSAPAGALLDEEQDPELEDRVGAGPVIVGRAFSGSELLLGLRVRAQFVTEAGEARAPLPMAPAALRELQPRWSFCYAVPADAPQSDSGVAQRLRLTATVHKVPLLAERTVMLDPSGVTDLGDLILSPPPIVASGVVIDQHGEPIAGAWIGERVDGRAMVGTERRARSALDGSFQVRNHERGASVALEAEFEGSDPATVTVERGGRVTIVVHRRLAIRGKIVWRLDAPKRAGAIHATCLSTGESESDSLAPDGTFECFVDRAGEYHVELGGAAWIGPRLSLLPRLDVAGDVDVGVLDVSLDVSDTRVTVVDGSGDEVDLLTLWCYDWGTGYPTSMLERMGQSRSFGGHHYLLHGLGTHKAVLSSGDRMATVFADGQDQHVELRPQYEVTLWPRRRGSEWDFDDVFGMRPAGNFDPREALTNVGLTGASFRLPHPGRWDVWIAPRADFSMDGPPLATIEVQDRGSKQSFHVQMPDPPSGDD